jgi:hypothetical protein
MDPTDTTSAQPLGPDAAGILAAENWSLLATRSLLVAGPHDLHPWAHFLVTAPTLVATVDAAIATAIVVLLLQATAAPPVAVVAAGAAAFLVVWGALFSVNARTARTLRATAPRFPTPAGDA